MHIATMVACVGAFGAIANGQVRTFEFTLSGDQEIPPAASDAAGTAVLEYDVLARTFDLELTTTGIELGELLGVGPNSTPIHIHAAPAGVGGPIVVDLGLFGSFVDIGRGELRFSVTDVGIGGPQGALGSTDPLANEALLFGAGLYINIHTQEFINGELRGQIVPSPGATTLLACAGLVLSRRRRNVAA